MAIIKKRTRMNKVSWIFYVIYTVNLRNIENIIYKKFINSIILINSLYFYYINNFIKPSIKIFVNNIY